jgi:hypothetical protein
MSVEGTLIHAPLTCASRVVQLIHELGLQDKILIKEIDLVNELKGSYLTAKNLNNRVRLRKTELTHPETGAVKTPKPGQFVVQISE